MNTMTYTVEKPLSQFEFWSGAKERTDHLTIEQLDRLDNLMPEVLGENPTDAAINNLFWFEEDYIAQLLGFNSFEALVRHNDGDDDDEDDNLDEDDEDEDEIGPGMESEFEDAVYEIAARMAFQDLFAKEGGAASDET